MVEEGLMTPVDRLMAVEQLVVEPETDREPLSQGNAEDLESEGRADGLGDRGGGWDPEVCGRARVTEDQRWNWMEGGA